MWEIQEIKQNLKGNCIIDIMQKRMHSCEQLTATQSQNC